MQFLGNQRHGFVGMEQLLFGVSDERPVNPFLGSDATRLPHHGAEVTLRETHTVGIIGYLVLLTAMLIDQTDETVEDGLFT